MALAEQATLLEEIRGPKENFVRQVRALDALMNSEMLTLDEYNKKLKELKEEFKKEVGSDVAEDIFGSLFEEGIRGIQDFDRTWKDFVAGFLSDLARIAQQQILLNLSKGFGNPLGFLPGFQHGGSFSVGGSGGPDSQAVAFRATPGERVDISPPGGAPAAGIKIVNVMDPNEIPEAMAGAEGEQVIINVISRNRTTVRQALG